MRYFLLAFLLVVLAIVSIAGCRGHRARRPPIELFADMDRQPKLRPQAPNSFFADRRSSRLPLAGTVARGAPYEETPQNTGRVPGTTNFVELLPVPVTAQLLARGQERYQVHCAVCHGAGGDGKGLVAKYQMVGMANFHDKRLVTMPDGEIFNTITHGKNLMSAYGPNVGIADRWAIVAYVRALQRSRLATLEDVPEASRSLLKQ
jgi:mono/diheme cytochrome c family protein